MADEAPGEKQLDESISAEMAADVDENATQDTEADASAPNGTAASDDVAGAASTSDQQQQTTGAATSGAAGLEARIPTKKDASLREFLGKMDDFAPIVRPFSLSRLRRY